MTTSPNLAVRVRETRSRLRLAQTQFAHLLGVSIQTVNRWENGKTQPLPGQLFYNTQTEIEELEEESTGQTELSKTRLGALEILILSLAIQSFLDKQVLSLRRKTILNDIQPRILTNIRD